MCVGNFTDLEFGDRTSGLTKAPMQMLSRVQQVVSTQEEAVGHPSPSAYPGGV